MFENVLVGFSNRRYDVGNLISLDGTFHSMAKKFVSYKRDSVEKIKIRDNKCDGPADISLRDAHHLRWTDATFADVVPDGAAALRNAFAVVA